EFPVPAPPVAVEDLAPASLQQGRRVFLTLRTRTSAVIRPPRCLARHRHPSTSRPAPPDDRGTTLPHDDGPDRVLRAGPGSGCGGGTGLWRTARSLFGQSQVGLVQLLDVDVLEGQHPHVLDEAGGAV